MKRIRVEEINGIIYIDGIDIIKKVSELSKENDRLYLENKKQKEVIDRIDKYIKENIYSYYDSKGEKCIEETVFERNANPKELLDILKEVEQ